MQKERLGARFTRRRGTMWELRERGARRSIDSARYSTFRDHMPPKRSFAHSCFCRVFRADGSSLRSACQNRRADGVGFGESEARRGMLLFALCDQVGRDWRVIFPAKPPPSVAPDVHARVPRRMSEIGRVNRASTQPRCGYWPYCSSGSPERVSPANGVAKNEEKLDRPAPRWQGCSDSFRANIRFFPRDRALALALVDFNAAASNKVRARVGNAAALLL